MAKLYIGTSGFSYPHWEKGVFYPAGLAKAKQLEYYSRHFQTVELNNTFYRLPTKENFQKWYQQTPQNFVFSLKASRYITHIKRLKDVQDSWQKFINNAQELKEKLGPILFQFPANFQVDEKRLEEFLKILPKKYKYAFEFRHQGWFCLSAGFTYLRLHGPTELYSSKYTDSQLKKIAIDVKRQLKDKDVYVYFNNDARGYALENALSLKKTIKKD